MKTCASCDKKIGPRSKKCKHCGYTVEKKSQTVAMGHWINDLPKGFSEAEQPESLPDRKLTLEELKDYIAYEGLGFCIYYYIEPSKIENKKVAKVWKEARESMVKVMEEIFDE
jgi:hypothetical protein